MYLELYNFKTVTVFFLEINKLVPTTLLQRGSNLWELIGHYTEKIGSWESCCKWEGQLLRDGKAKEIMMFSFCKSCCLEELGFHVVFESGRESPPSALF